MVESSPDEGSGFSMVTILLFENIMVSILSLPFKNWTGSLEKTDHSKSDQFFGSISFFRLLEFTIKLLHLALIL